MPERERADRRRERQRHGLGQVGPDELVGAEHRVREQQQDDHQRTDPTEVRPTMRPPSMPMATVAVGRASRVDDADARCSGSSVEVEAQDHGGGTDEQGRAEDSLDGFPALTSCSQQVQQVGAEERHRDRAEHHPADEAEVDGPFAGARRPNGRITTAATRSLEIAFEGVTLNSRISIGVISAPPPAPVMPTRKPTTALPRTM